MSVGYRRHRRRRNGHSTPIVSVNNKEGKIFFPQDTCMFFPVIQTYPVRFIPVPRRAFNSRARQY